MKAFMDENFLLETKTAQELYHKYAKEMPIVDYHCHINPREIYEDKKFENITQVWLLGDHYKWRQMRSNGIEEYYITGNASDWEKFQKWAQTLEKAIGNPLYHWSHLELQRYFGYDKVLNRESAEMVWQLCNKQLREDKMSTRNLIRKSGVKLICTTDDPIDSLYWHQKLKEDCFEVQVLPTWRPDRAMSLEKGDYPDYLKELEEISKIKICSFSSLIEALKKRMDFFETMGCRLSDHGLAMVVYAPSSKEEVENIFKKRIEGVLPSKKEEAKFKYAFMVAMGREYNKKGWVMQLHYGVKRDNNERIFKELKADAGVDCINNAASSGQLADFLNALDKTNELPKTILYSLNPADNAIIGTIIGCFQDSSAIGKIQQGSAWWFNDHKTGMINQIISLASLGLLGNFIGMLTDSRSFLSYVRHEYFRRILCNLIGTWVEHGEYPNDDKNLKELIKGICYNNAVRYFQFHLEMQ